MTRQLSALSLTPTLAAGGRFTGAWDQPQHVTLPPFRAHAEYAPQETLSLPDAVAVRRAGEFLLWLAGLVALAALIGFIPAIGVFTFLYMGFGFREKLPRSAVFGVAMAQPVIPIGGIDVDRSTPSMHARLSRIGDRPTVVSAG